MVEIVKLEYSVEKPLNREPELAGLVSSFITTDGYDRNHGPIPHLNASSHRLTVDGLVHTTLTLSMADLHSLPQHSVICALQCAGNRRHTMRTKLKEVDGIDWFDGAVMNCHWSGPLLCDVLLQAGLALTDDEMQDAHVALACHQTACQDDSFYGVSIPLSRAMDRSASILLALRMNDAALPPKHGAPVRVVTPGIAGARSVKWLDRITVQLCESHGYYQQRDYKILPEEADCKDKAELYWPKCDAILDMPVNSVIGVPAPGATVSRDEQGCVRVKGYALPSGAHGPIVRVQVSVDEGATWTDAELMEQRVGPGVEVKWAWCLWEASVKIDKGSHVSIYSRATDRSGHTQEKCPKWNFRGVAYNGYGETSGLHIV